MAKVVAPVPSASALEATAVRQQGVTRVPPGHARGTAGAMGHVRGSVAQNKVPRTESGRHSAMGQAAQRKAAIVTDIADLGTGMALPDQPLPG